jgi:hypothetical protein
MGNVGSSSESRCIKGALVDIFEFFFETPLCLVITLLNLKISRYNHVAPTIIPFNAEHKAIRKFIDKKKRKETQ